MRKNLLYSLLLSAGALALVSCSDDFTPGGSGTGKILPKVSLNTEAVKAKPSRAAQAISANDLTLRLTSLDGTSAPRTWASVAEFNDNEEFKVGDYTLEAYYGTPESQGFDAPYYYGAASLSVAENKVTNATLSVNLANSMVTIAPTANFTGYFTAASFSIASANSAEEIAYAVDETRPAYVQPGEISIYATVTKPNGVTLTNVLAATFTAEARNHYTVTVDVNDGNVGNATMLISFDDTLDSEEVIEIELSDDLVATPAPTVTVSGYDANANYAYIQGNKPAELAPSMLINAPGGIKSIKMTVSSAWLSSKGLASEVELVGNTPDKYQAYKALGIEGRYNTVSRMAQINLAALFSNIRYIEGDATNTTSVAFIVTDKQGKQSDPVVFSATVDKVVAQIAEAPEFYAGDTEMLLSVDYNGNDFENDVTFKYLNDRDTYTAASYTIVSKPSRSSVYVVRISGLPESGSVTLRMFLNGELVKETVVNRTEINLTADNNDVFAKSATVTLSSDEIDVAAKTATFEVSTDGANYTAVSAEKLANNVSYKLSGLTPGTNYKVRATIGKDRATCNIATEAAAQIPNGDMEAWSSADSGKNWNLYVLGSDASNSVWGTNNPMTTSQGANMAYTRATTTKPTTDAHTGSNAAWIRSMGWGAGNTAAGDMSARVMKYGDAGLLHLGSSRSSRPSDATGVAGPISTADLNCGMTFGSRPASISFWYKYSPKNGSDKGVVEFWLKDVDGNNLASQTLNLDAAGSYTQVTIPVTYTAGAKKAASIYVKFLSSSSSDYLTKDTKNFTSPRFGNTSDGEYLGSQLFIDDVTLNY